MKPTAIYLDIDGVLADFHSAAFGLFDVGPHAVADIHGWDAMPEVLTRHTGREVTPSDLWGRVAQEGAPFWSSLPWLPWGRELIRLCEMAAPVVLMTTPADAASAHGKVEWIFRELPPEWRKRYAVTTCKHHMAHPGALLIDDAQANVDKFIEHGGEAFLWPQPWNSAGDEAALDLDRAGALSRLRLLLGVG